MKRTMGGVRVTKDAEIKARVDARTKRDVEQLAYARDLDASDILREAVRMLLSSRRSGGLARATR